MKLDRNFLDAAFPKVEEAGNPPWLITFADLVSLMLVFFVMLFAMSNMEREQWQEILGRDPVPQVIEQPETLAEERSMERALVEEARDPDYLLSVFRTKLESDPLLKDLPVRSYGDRIVLSIPAELLAADLPAGDADSDADNRNGSLIHALGGALQTLPNQIVVDGYAPADFAGNRWEVSLRLAYLVAGGLEAAGIDGRILARGRVAGKDGPAPGQAGGVDVVLLDGTAPILAPVGTTVTP